MVPKDVCHFGKRLTELEELEGGRIQLHFKDGSTAEADCVVSAEGIHSVVRKHLLSEGDPAVEPQFSGSVAYRGELLSISAHIATSFVDQSSPGLIPMEKAVEAIGARYAQNAIVWCGSGGCVMIYPIDFGETMNIVAINSEYKTWEGPWVQKADHKKIEKEFSAWADDPKKVVKLLDNEDTAAW